MKMRILLGFMAMMSLGLSVNIYTDLRGYNGRLFDLGNRIFPVDLLQLSKGLRTDAFILYNLPDGLWLLSLLLVMILIWSWVETKDIIVWLTLGLWMSLFLEIFQLIGWVHGTFDLIDMMTYILTFLCSLLFLLISKFKLWKIGKHIYFHS